MGEITEDIRIMSNPSILRASAREDAVDSIDKIKKCLVERSTEAKNPSFEISGGYSSWDIPVVHRIFIEKEIKRWAKLQGYRAIFKGQKILMSEYGHLDLVKAFASNEKVVWLTRAAFWLAFVGHSLYALGLLINYAHGG